MWVCGSGELLIRAFELTGLCVLANPVYQMCGAAVEPAGTGGAGRWEVAQEIDFGVGFSLWCFVYVYVYGHVFKDVGFMWLFGLLSRLYMYLYVHYFVELWVWSGDNYTLMLYINTCVLIIWWNVYCLLLVIGDVRWFSNGWFINDTCFRNFYFWKCVSLQ